MASTKLRAGDVFPKMTVKKLGGGELVLGEPQQDAPWHMVLVYRGKHCPLCSLYLSQLKEMKNDFLWGGVDIAVVSADPEEKAQVHAVEELKLPFDVGFDLSVAQMQRLGLYISHPRSPQETDRPFAEPALFIINEEGKLHITDLSNNPFFRPELDKVLSGIQWLRDPKNNYPIRGTYE